MNIINNEQHHRFVFTEPRIVFITLVGVGGTGSALAVDLARMAYHCSSKGLPVNLQLIDDDIVEPKNVGRQQFSQMEIGENKAVSMARRLNRWLGLSIAALPERFTAETKLIGDGTFSGRRIIVGAVDNWQARAAIAQCARDRHSDLWWVDAGNGEFTGQVLVGNRHDHIDIYLNEMALVSNIPGPGMQMPELLRPEENEAPQPELDCALAVIAEEQSLHINRLMAVYAAQYVADIVLRRELNTMGASISISPPGVTGIPITARTLEACPGVTVTNKYLDEPVSANGQVR